jgi:IrrE N-terminal-like domain
MLDAADQQVAWLLDRVGVASQPPVDLIALAERMGIEAIHDSPMIEDGRLEQRSGKAVIYVRDDLEGGRRQFTIAHELGHRLLLHPRAPATEYRRRLTGDELERFCDDVAAAILLPRTWVEQTFANEPRQLKTIRRMAAMSSTSLSASLVRLRVVQRWPQSLLRFTYHAGRWRLASPAGVPRTLYGRLRTSTATDHILASTGTKTSADIMGVLPLHVACAELEFLAELSVGKSTAIALLDLARPQLAQDAASQTPSTGK